jgi:hypothetical protein
MVYTNHALDRMNERSIPGEVVLVVNCLGEDLGDRLELNPAVAEMELGLIKRMMKLVKRGSFDE